MKTIILFLMHILPAFAQKSFQEREIDFSERVRRACQTDVKFDVHDYEYSTDENKDFEQDVSDCEAIANNFASACEAHPKNMVAASRIKMVFCKRASFGERKLILRKNGDLIYLIGRNPKEQDDPFDLLKADMAKGLGFDFNANKEAEVVSDKEAEDEKKREAQVAAQVKKAQDAAALQEKKTQEIINWYQTETQKLMANPTDPQLSNKMNDLVKKYQEKLNALQKNP
jgi:hypothetical protein